MGTINGPITNEEVVRSLGSVPIYPKAKLDMATTRIIRGTAAGIRMFTGKQTFTAAAFRVPAAPEIAVNWYDVQLGKLGYVPTKARQSTIGQKMEHQIMHQYFKKNGKEIVMVQAGVMPEDKKTDPADATMLIVIRMSNPSKASLAAPASPKPFVPDAPAKK
jgi:hypothetical protein